MEPLEFVLFPGRHHVLTRFQAGYLRDLLSGGCVDRDGAPVSFVSSPRVVWAVTSANHANTRRNPVPFDRREAMIERFSVMEGLCSLVVPVFDVAETDRFASVTLKNVESCTGSRLVLTPENTLVACSTPAVFEMYERQGFRVATVELDAPSMPPRPWDVLELLVAGDSSWRSLAHPATLDVFDRYALDEQVVSVCNDPLVGSEGSLTSTRQYRTYVESFERDARRKLEPLLPHVRPGRIVDVGCATGAMLELLSAESSLRESDLYGIEVSRHLFEECLHKKAQGVFGNPNTFFFMRNVLAGPVFPPRSVDTTLTFALTHEVVSYGGGVAALRAFAATLFEHTVPGGVWINSDVCGPSGGAELVVLELRDDDGLSVSSPLEDLGSLPAAEVTAYVSSLSTLSRFYQFAFDFPRLSGRPLPFEEVSPVRLLLPLRSAMEFLESKDYADNWLSECHETFTELDFSAWVDLVRAAGFDVDASSAGVVNEWMVENRFEPVARLLDPADLSSQLPWPVTHVQMVARRPLNS